MNPILDQLLVAVAIAGALAFFGIRAFRSRRKKSCGGNCGCSAANPLKAGKRE